ncbi:MAG: S1C family serine protease, partial [Actinomycetota bacterium]
MKTRLLALVVLLASACSLNPEVRSTQPGPEVTFERSEEAPPHSSVSDVVEDVLPSVVNVRVEAVSSGAFGDVRQEGQGSGVIIDEGGTVLTNNHVVQCAAEGEVDVILDDGREVTGTVVGTVPERDLAVVRVDASGLDALVLGNSSELRLGDDVVALGFPLGLGGPTVTKGIVSGKGRSIQPQGGPALGGLIQTDAAINPGNSGGALVDAAGRLVGINTAAAGAGTAENIGFAIPIDAAVPVVEEILRGDERAWLGVSMDSVDSAAEAAQLGLDPDVRGAVIVALLEGPAADAGLREGEVIVAIEGREIDSADALSEVLAGFSP